MCCQKQLTGLHVLYCINPIGMSQLYCCSAHETGYIWQLLCSARSSICVFPFQLLCSRQNLQSFSTFVVLDFEALIDPCIHRVCILYYGEIKPHPEMLTKPNSSDCHNNSTASQPGSQRSKTCKILLHLCISIEICRDEVSIYEMQCVEIIQLHLISSLTYCFRELP